MRPEYTAIATATEHSIGLRRSMTEDEARRLLNELPEPVGFDERQVSYLLWAIANPDDDADASQS